MRLSRIIAASSAFVISTAGVVVLATANAQAAVPGVDSDIHISEVFADGGASSGTDATFPHDFIELTNTGSQDETLTGWTFTDDTDSHIYPIDAGTAVPAGGTVSFNVDDTTHTAGSFGLGKSGDAARLFDGTKLVDQFWFTAAAGDGKDYSRCSIGGGAFAIVVSTAITPGAANSCPTPAAAEASVKALVKVNEVLANGVGSGSAQDLDAIELYTAGTMSVNLSGWWLSDDKAADKDVLPAGTFIAPTTVTGSSTSRPKDYLTYRVGASASSTNLAQDIFLDTSGNPLPGNKDFGLGASGDNAALVAPDGTDADRVAFGSDNAAIPAPSTAGTTLSRCPDGTGSFSVTATATLGATNVCGAVTNPADTTVKINEVDLTNHLVELINTGSAAANVTGFTLKDVAAQTLTLSSTNTTASTIPAAGYAEISYGSTLTPVGNADTVTLADGTTTVDSAAWSASILPSLGRCPDGTGAFATTAAVTDGGAGSVAGANNCTSGTTAGYNTIRVSEIETNGDPLGDWIELTNTGSTAVNISGLYLADNGGTQGDPTIFPTDASHSYKIPGSNQNPADVTTAGNTVLAAHGYQAFFESNSFPFGLGNPDQARIFSPSKALIDSAAWPLHESGATYQRCPGVTQGVDFTDTADGAAFTDSQVSTPNAANQCTPPIRINEVQASDVTGGPDWIELTNVGSQPVDLSGWVLTDDKDTDGDVIPSGVTLNPGAFISFDPNNENGQFTTTTPASKPFGLGATGDEVRLYESGAWSGTAYVAADLVDGLIFEDASTKSGGAIQPQTVLANGAKAGGAWPVNATSPSSPETYARCSDGVSQVATDGTGAWEVTSHPTQGATNQCDGLFTAQPFPDTHNGQAVTTADNTDLGQNLSGLYYVGGDPRTTADDYMWGIQNGASGLPGENAGDPGALYKLVQDPSGSWGPAAGWDKGVPVRYLNNTTGEIDAEGVTSTAGKVYVTSERDNTNSDVSRIAVVEVDPNHIVAQNGDADGDLNATHDWELGSDLGPNPGTNPETGINPNNPGDANLGLEAIAFVPDSALTADGFKDEHTGATYDPSNYPNHVDGGVFFVGLEKTGKLYAYIFNSDNTWTRIATINTGFQTIQDLLWDPTQDALWATCDNGCQGRQSIIKIDTNSDANKGTFQVNTIYSRPTGATQNLNNEGFTVAPISECVKGSRSVYWSDDSDDGNHWLRTAKVDCIADTTNPTITAVPSVVANANGWNNTPVTVSFTCTDPAGVDATDSSLPTQAFTTSGSVTATCVDNVGNSATSTYVVQIDTTNPVIIATPSVPANTNGWNNTAVTVAFGCTDAGSGVDAAHSMLSSQTLTATGSVTGLCADEAGNAASATYAAQIDTTKPTITFAGNTGTYGLLDTVGITCTPADAQSGIATATCPSASGQAYTFGPGSHTLNGTVTDKAGNSVTASATFTVTARPADIAGLLQQFVAASAKYKAANLITAIGVAVQVNLANSVIEAVSPSELPVAKAILIGIYNAELGTFVSGGYLTPAQRALLIGFANTV